MSGKGGNGAAQQGRRLTFQSADGRDLDLGPHNRNPAAVSPAVEGPTVERRKGGQGPDPVSSVEKPKLRFSMGFRYTRDEFEEVRLEIAGKRPDPDQVERLHCRIRAAELVDGPSDGGLSVVRPRSGNEPEKMRREIQTELNRLTSDTFMQVIEKLTTERPRSDFQGTHFTKQLAQVISDQAAQGPAFSMLYARLVRSLGQVLAGFPEL